VFALRVEKMKRAGPVCFRVVGAVGLPASRGRGVDGPATGHLCPSAHPPAFAATPFTFHLLPVSGLLLPLLLLSHMSAPFGLMECVSFVLSAPLFYAPLFKVVSTFSISQLKWKTVGKFFAYHNSCSISGNRVTTPPTSPSRFIIHPKGN